jgi:photosystem II stability/assembly factor-like uncharacterized protein
MKRKSLKPQASRCKLQAAMLLFALSPALFALSQQYGWTDISANLTGSPDLSGVFFVSDNEGWISVSSGPEIYHTTDGGATFEIQTNQFSTALEAIFMIDENEGFTGGGSGFVYRTTDGGENWDFHGSIPSTLTDIDFGSDTQEYACGDGGAVFSVSPQGVTNLNSGQPTNFSGISSPSVNNVWLCGGNDIMYYNGSTFEFQSGPAGTYNAICFVNDDFGWVVGTAGLIGHTENQGEDWHRQTNPDPDLHSLYDLFFLDENKGWAVGSQGTIIHTIDGGETWELQALGLTINFLRGVHFTSLTNGYVVGNEKTLLKYTEIAGISDQELNAGDIVLFPNPTWGKFQITSTIRQLADQTNSKIQIQNFEIIDLYGKSMTIINNRTIEQLNSGTLELDISHLPSGIYFIRINLENQTIVKKIIKL